MAPDFALSPVQKRTPPCAGEHSLCALRSTLPCSGAHPALLYLYLFLSLLSPPSLDNESGLTLPW